MYCHSLETRRLLTAELIADINQVPVPNYVSAVTLVGSHGFFTATGPAGNELYRTDSTFTSASLVRDLRPGSASSQPTSLTAVGSEVYFAADDGQNGRELYRSDGTDAGTVRVTDLIPTGQINSSIQWLAALTDRVLFVATIVPESFGTATLYAYTPSTGQLVTLFNTYAHFEGIGILQPVAAGNLVYFPAVGDGGIWRLWKTDGTAAGTVPVHDLIANSFPPTTPTLAAFNDRLLFNASTSSKGTELYITDGTQAGTGLLRDISWGTASSTPQNFRIIGNEAYFSADDGIHGREVWKTDGTSGGTTLVADVEPGSGSSSPSLFAQSGSFITFIATAGPMGNAIWSSNGVKTQMLLDLGESTLDPRPNNIVTLNDFALFNYSDAVSGEELWRTDGTPAGTSRVVDLNPGVLNGTMGFYQATVIPLGVLYMGNDGVHGGELWRSDGTAAGTLMVQDIRRGTSGSINNEGAVLSNGKFYHRYGANDGVSGYEPWVFDRNGAHRLGDLMPGLADSYPSGFVNAGEVTYFGGRDPEHGSELWRTDGTAAGTRRVTDINAGANHSLSGALAGTAAGNVFFFANDGVIGSQLWFSDGTEAGTHLLSHATVSSQYSLQSGLYNAGEAVIYLRRDTATGRYQVWRSDAIGTRSVELPATAGSFSTNSEILAHDGSIFFTIGGRVWRSDATSAGTYSVSPAAANSSIALLKAWNGSVYYSTGNFSSVQLWRSDGTPTGGVLVKNFGEYGYILHYYVAVSGNRLVFAGQTAANGREIWSTDGTTAGTFLVKDITPGPGHTDLSDFLSVGDLVFVRQGSTLWVTDGKPGSASRVDLGIGGPESFGFYFFGASDGVLYLDLWNEQYGREPWQFEYAGRDLLAPSVGSSSFDVDRREVSFTLSETASVAALTGVTLLNKRTGVSVAIPENVIRLQADGRQLIIDLTHFNFADSDYAIRIPAGIVSDEAGNLSQDPHEHSFFYLTGDANRDRKVDFADLHVLAQNYSQSGRTFTQGNFDYSPDGKVDFNDLLLLAQRYGTSLHVNSNVGIGWAVKRRSAVADVLS